LRVCTYIYTHTQPLRVGPSAHRERIGRQEQTPSDFELQQQWQCAHHLRAHQYTFSSLKAFRTLHHICMSTHLYGRIHIAHAHAHARTHIKAHTPAALLAAARFPRPSAARSQSSAAWSLPPSSTRAFLANTTDAVLLRWYASSARVRCTC
jgi:hypothetical protein